jgi:hypothetical protein
MKSSLSGILNKSRFEKIDGCAEWFQPSKKYRFKAIEYDGRKVQLNWFYDHEVEQMLNCKEGELISLERACEIYYDAVYNVTTGFNEKIHQLNILGFTISKGYRVDLLPYLIKQEGLQE